MLRGKNAEFPNVRAEGSLGSTISIVKPTNKRTKRVRLKLRRVSV
jgi:hypothetical protein